MIYNQITIFFFFQITIFNWPTIILQYKDTNVWVSQPEIKHIFKVTISKIGFVFLYAASFIPQRVAHGRHLLNALNERVTTLINCGSCYWSFLLPYVFTASFHHMQLISSYKHTHTHKILWQNINKDKAWKSRRVWTKVERQNMVKTKMKMHCSWVITACRVASKLPERQRKEKTLLSNTYICVTRKDKISQFLRSSQVLS